LLFNVILNIRADKHPEKLAELQKIFDEEAWKYNVYPLYDDMIKRLSSQEKRLFGDQKEFVYFAPGALCVSPRRLLCRSRTALTPSSQTSVVSLYSCDKSLGALCVA
jgi:arylsulfatase